MKNFTLNTAGILLLILFIAVIFFSPFITIWSLNTLFGLAITYTFETWAAAGVLSAVVSGGFVSLKK